MSDFRPSHGVRRFLSPFGAVSAVATLGAVLLITGCDAEAQRDADAQRADGRPATSLAPALPSTPAPPITAPRAGVLTGSPAPAATKADGAGGSAAGIATAPISVRYTFDGGLGRAIADVDDQFPLRPISQNDGTLTFVPRDGGLALQFPPRCTAAEEEVCPRAILEGMRIDALNPGTRPLRYGASIRMTRDDLADGANVMQKGYSVGGITQFKLQVDHLAGHPSCVIAGENKIFKAESEIDIADGAWHQLSCARNGARLTIAIDGVDQDSVYVPPALSIANAEPLRVGGKGARARNDQYAGQIDDVHLAID